MVRIFAFGTAPAPIPSGPVAWTFLIGGSSSPIATISGVGPAGITDTGVVIPATGTVNVTVTHSDANRYSEVMLNPALTATVDAAALHALSTNIPDNGTPNVSAGTAGGIGTTLRHPDRPDNAGYFTLDVADNLLIAVFGDNGAWFSRGTVEIT